MSAKTKKWKRLDRGKKQKMMTCWLDVWTVTKCFISFGYSASLICEFYDKLLASVDPSGCLGVTSVLQSWIRLFREHLEPRLAKTLSHCSQQGRFRLTLHLLFNRGIILSWKLWITMSKAKVVTIYRVYCKKLLKWFDSVYFIPHST